jgi:hypothetical protein
MLLEKLNKQDIELLGTMHDPVALSEVLFTEKVENFETLKYFDEESFFKVRLYQIPMMSYEYLLADNADKTENENFEIKKKAGKGYYYCGRKIGKSLVALLIDLLIDTIHNFFDWVTAFSSVDYIHLAHIFEPYITVMENHPFFKFFNLKVNRKEQKATIPSGHVLHAVNMTLGSKKPGTQWERLHAHKIIIDEHQYETDEIAHKRSQAVSERGCIERFAGITSFKSHTPAGKIYNDLERRNWLLNIPETVSPFWNEQRKEEARKDYSGEDSFGYRINVLAEVCENAVGTYDIERIRQSYNYKKTVKSFEIDKVDYSNIKKKIFDMEDKIVVDRPKNVFRVWIGADFGESPAPTEIAILFEYEQDPDNIFKYIYNITLSRMTPNEQTEIFEYLIAKLTPNFIAIDCTEQGGRQIFRNLEEKFGRDNLIWVGFNEKIEVGFEKDAQGHVIYEKGEPKKLYEYITDWSVRRLKTLLYNKKIVIYKDYKFDRQFNAMVSTQSGNRVIYGSSESNHIHQAFQTFAIAQWKNEFNLIKPLQHKKWCKGGY